MTPVPPPVCVPFRARGQALAAPQGSALGWNVSALRAWGRRHSDAWASGDARRGGMSRGYRREPSRWHERGAGARGYQPVAAAGRTAMVPKLELGNQQVNCQRAVDAWRSVEADGEAVAEAVVVGAGEELGGKTEGHLEGVGPVVVLGEGEFLKLMEEQLC